MATSAKQLLRQIQRLVSQAPSGPATDAALLDRFVRCKNEAAFAALVARHGPMVVGVCRGVLRDAHEAEDAAQATFLVLAHKAATIRRPDVLAAWLHRAARHLALKYRRADVRRREREVRSFQAAPAPAPPDPLDELSVRELLAILDEELQRLPDGYRVPLILCCLEGRTQEEAARQLGWTPGAVKGRLERGRAKLHRRLVGRGLTLATVLAALEAAQGMASAARMPAGFAPAALLATARGTPGTGGTDGGIATEVVALAEEGMRSMAMTKTKVALALLLAAGVVAGVGALAQQESPASQRNEKQLAEPEARSKKVEPPNEKQQARTDRYGDPLPDGALVRLGTLRWRAGSEVNALAYSPDGKTLAATSRSGVCLFDTATGKATMHLRSSDPMFGRIAFAPDGKRLLASSSTWKTGERMKRSVQIWELPDGRKTLEAGGENVQWLGWSADDKPLAVYLVEGAVLLRELASGKEKRFEAKDLPTPARGLSACAYVAGGKVLAVPDKGGLIHVWDAIKGEERCALQDKGGYVSRLAISPDGLFLASLTSGNTKSIVRLWDVAGGKAAYELAAEKEYLCAVLFAPDGKTLVTVGHWEEARFWEVETGRERGRTKGGRSFAAAVAFSPDGKTLATVEQYTGAIHLWDVATGELKPQPAGHTNRPIQAAFSPDGRRVATGSMDGSIFIWDLSTGERLAEIRRPYRWVRGYAFSADGRSLYSSWDDDKLIFSDAATGRELHVIRMEDPDRPDTRQSGMYVCLSDDRKTLVALSYYYPKKEGGPYAREFLVTSWDVATRKQLFRRRREAVDFGIALTPDARAFAASQGGVEGNGEKVPGKGPMWLEDLATGEQLLALPAPEGQTSPLAFSPDGRLLASITYAGESTRTLRLWETATAAEVLALPASYNARVAFSSDGRLLALSVPEQEILLWDLRRGKEWQRLKGFAADVTGLAFSPDSRRLVSGLSDSTVLVWQVADVREAARPVGLGPEGAARDWADLAVDAPKAFAARWTLAGSPAVAVPLLKERLKPTRPADPKRLRQLLADLDSDRFAVREGACKELEALGELAAPALRQVLEGKPSPEVCRQIEALREKLHGPVTRPEALQALRAVAVLEDVATPEARQVLETLAKGEPEVRLTREAKASLERLARRPTVKP
jgi:RNA polymerase sigma factor (sigma-70 family)